jgi:hypothetical protein
MISIGTYIGNVGYIRIMTDVRCIRINLEHIADPIEEDED